MIIIDVILSIVLIYYFLRKKHSTNSTMLGSLLFLASTPLTFHSHRHIMFMSYMSFLILSLIGVDRYFDKNKKGLLIISLFLLYMTSYYFSISSIFCVVLYGIYRYIKDKRTNFIKEGIKFSYPIIISILMACILILPTFYVLLNGRGDTHVVIDILSLFKPNIIFNSFLYDPYGMGLTTISLIFLISNLFSKKENRFLSISLLLVIIFPIFTYILNATMYVEYKVLVPLIPLVILLVSDSLENLKELDYNKLNIISMIILIINLILKNYIFSLGIVIVLSVLNLYKVRKCIFPIIFYIVLSSYFVMLKTNLEDNLLEKDLETNLKEVDYFIDYLDKNDDSFYRTVTLVDIHKNLNRIPNLNNYTLNVYSSVSSSDFNNLVFDVFNNPISYRNRAIVTSGNNYFYNNYMGVKYIISKKNISSDYELITSKNKINLYKNPNAYSLGYVTNNVISVSDYNKLKYPYTVESIMNGVVIDGKTTFNDYKIKEYKFDIDSYSYENLDISKIEDKYIIKSTNGKLVFKLKKEIKDKVILIRFNNSNSNSCNIGDTKITINSISNKLTCKEWKYHNNNYVFDYVLSNNFSELVVKFSKGEYEISDIEIYEVSKSDLNNNHLGEFIVDNDKTKGDNISGNIEVLEDGYFILNIPYDKGYKIYVDNKETKYVEVNENFMGFKINKGTHEIRIEYTSPFKKVGSILSIIGFILFIIEIRRCKNEKN